MEEEYRARARRRSHHARVLPGRDLQGTAYPLWRQARRRMGEPAEQQCNLRRQHAPRLHGERRPARNADGAQAPGRTPRRGVSLPLPRTTLLRQFDTCRAIPSRFAARNDSVLAGIAEDDAHLSDLFELDTAT